MGMIDGDGSSGRSDDRIRHPFRVGAFYAAIVLGFFAAAAAWRMLRYRELLPDADWRVIGAIPAGLAAICFGYAYLGAAIGAKRAHQIALIVLGVVLIAGVYVMTRLLDGRRS